MSKKKYDLLADPVGKIFPRFLLSGIVATLMISANYLIDTICIGQMYGETSLAALNVAVPVTGFLYALGYLFGYGGSILYSTLLGEGKNKEARNAYSISFYSLLLLSVTIMVLGVVFLEPISRLLSGGGSILAGTRDYLRYVFWLSPFYCMHTFICVFFRNDNAPVLSAIINTGSCSINIILDILFIFVFDWGMWGASLATGLALVIAASFGLISMLFGKHSGLGRPGRPIAIGRVSVQIMRTGLPSSIREMAASVVTLAINFLLLRLAGEMGVAAYGIIANLATIIMCFLGGACNAMQPIVSINAGAGYMDRVFRTRRLAMLSTLVISAAYLVLAELWPNVLLNLFVESENETFITLCMAGIRIVSPSYLLAGISTLLNVYMEALSETKLATVMSIHRGIMIPLMCVLVCVNLWDVQGVWASFILTEVVAFLMALALAHRATKNAQKVCAERLAAV